MSKELEEFLSKEFEITPDHLMAMDADAISDIFDDASDIEVGEVLAGRAEGDRCRLACELQDYINDNLM